MVGGTRAMFKFVHKEGPIMSVAHLFDDQVTKISEISNRVDNNEQGNELVKEDEDGQSTLFHLSKEEIHSSSDLRSKIRSGVSVTLLGLHPQYVFLT